MLPCNTTLEHHLLVVLKAQNGQHKGGLIECTKDDLAYLGATVSYCCSILRQLSRVTNRIKNIGKR
jgi:hypothetical protein